MEQFKPDLELAKVDAEKKSKNTFKNLMRAGVIAAAAIGVVGCEDKEAVQSPKTSNQEQKQIDNWVEQKSDEVDAKWRRIEADADTAKTLAAKKGVSVDVSKGITFKKTNGQITEVNSVDVKSEKKVNQSELDEFLK